jgi:transcriptional regulator
MYQPPHFREDRIEVQHDLIRTHPLGLLISAGPGGLMANPIPFLIDADASERGTLRCHLARANAQWRELAAVAHGSCATMTLKLRRQVKSADWSKPPACADT